MKISMSQPNLPCLQASNTESVASLEPGKDPYRTLDDVTKIKGRFDFEFKANC